MRTRLVFISLAVLVLSACSGGTGTASQLTYTNPPATNAGWKLVKDPSSTSTRLVLALVGPTGVKTRGVGFNLKADPSVHFVTFDGGSAVQDTGVYQLKSAVPDPTLPADIAEPTFMAAGVKPDNVLTVGIFQKDRTLDAVDSGVPVLRIALAIAPGAKVGSLGLQVLKAKFMPEDIGGTTDSVSILTKSRLAPAGVSVGTLQAN